MLSTNDTDFASIDFISHYFLCGFQYLGSWYEIERFDIIWQLGMDCVEAIYTDIGKTKNWTDIDKRETGKVCVCGRDGGDEFTRRWV